MSKQVSETAKALREAECGLVSTIVDAKSYNQAWIVAILADYGSALLAHHKAVEAEQTRLAGEFLLGGPEDPKKGDPREAKAD